MKDENEKYYFDQEAADNAVRFIETNCHHVAGKWAAKYDRQGNRQDTRIKLAEWQKEEIIRPLFGWKRKDNDLRRYTTLYVEIPKKNGKTLLIACIELIFLLLDREPGSELYIACPVSRDQAASLLLEPVRAMIDANPRLGKFCRVMGTRNYTKTILTDNAFLKPLTSDAKASEGIKPQAGFVDETHVFKDAGVLDNLEKSMIMREQPLICYTTTAGNDLGSIGYEKHEYYKNVKNGVIEDDSALVVMYSADPKDDPFSEDTWRKANPMWDISINKDQFLKEVKKAKESPTALNSFKRYHLNIWTNSKEAFVTDDVWQQAYEEIDEKKLFEMDCILGFDLGATSDITAISAQFWDGEKCISRTHYYLPEMQSDHSIKDRVRYYDKWVAEGYVEEMIGTTRDDDVIVAVLLELVEKYKVVGIGYDPYQATNIANKLRQSGFDENKIWSIRTGAKSISEPMRIFQDMIINRKFNHLKDPVLRWMNSNLSVKIDQNNNMIPDRSGRRHKIDGILSNLYALALKLEMDKQDPGETYLQEGELWVM